MFLFIIAIIVFVVGISIGLYLIADFEKTPAIITMIIAVILCAILIGMSCFTRVPAGHTGVVTTFGRVEDRTLDSGPNWVSPWQRVINMDNRVQKETVTLMCFSSDIQEVSMVYTVNFQIDKANAMTIYRTIGTHYYETVIMPSIAESVKIVAAQYTAEDLVGMRSELAAAIEVELSEKLASYNIEVVSTSIEDMDFTDAFTNAVEEKQVAEQNMLRAQTEAERATIEAAAAAEVQRIEAQGKADAQLIAAEAEAEANRKIAESLNEDILSNKFIEAWNGELPMVTGSDGSLINIPIGASN